MKRQKPYSSQIKVRAIQLLLEGLSYRDIAELMDISIASVSLWAKEMMTPTLKKLIQAQKKKSSLCVTQEETPLRNFIERKGAQKDFYAILTAEYGLMYVPQHKKRNTWKSESHRSFYQAIIKLGESAFDRNWQKKPLEERLKIQLNPFFEEDSYKEKMILEVIEEWTPYMKQLNARWRKEQRIAERTRHAVLKMFLATPPRGEYPTP